MTKLPAHAYHQLQYRHKVWVAHIGACHRVTETLQRTCGMDGSGTVVVNRCMCSDDGTQCCCYLHHTIPIVSYHYCPYA